MESWVGPAGQILTVECSSTKTDRSRGFPAGCQVELQCPPAAPTRFLPRRLYGWHVDGGLGGPRCNDRVARKFGTQFRVGDHRRRPSRREQPRWTCPTRSLTADGLHAPRITYADIRQHAENAGLSHRAGGRGDGSCGGRTRAEVTPLIRDWWLASDGNGGDWGNDPETSVVNAVGAVHDRAGPLRDGRQHLSHLFRHEPHRHDHGGRCALGPGPGRAARGGGSGMSLSGTERKAPRRTRAGHDPRWRRAARCGCAGPRGRPGGRCAADRPDANRATAEVSRPGWTDRHARRDRGARAVRAGRVRGGVRRSGQCLFHASRNTRRHRLSGAGGTRRLGRARGKRIWPSWMSWQGGGPVFRRI